MVTWERTKEIKERTNEDNSSGSSKPRGGAFPNLPDTSVPGELLPESPAQSNMRTHFLPKLLSGRTYFIIVLGALFTLVLVGFKRIDLDFSTIALNTRRDIIQDNCSDCSSVHVTSAPNVMSERQRDQNAPDTCKGCRKLISKVLKDYSLNWTRNETNHQELRSLLINNCNGFQKAFVTQSNSPLGTTIAYDGEKRVRTVNEDLFNKIPKNAHFSNKILDTCAVVGNGGILVNSSCGEAIDSAQFVIRCNLPPINKDYGKHVGKKTNIVTANPTIIQKKYAGLRGYRRGFADDVSVYGESLLFLPAFSFAFCTGLSMSVLYSLEDFRSSVKPVFLNPEYLKSLDKFWRSQKLNPRVRISTGFMMVSLALEICNNVDVYGFWPFEYHPHNFQPCTNHYYDNQKAGTFHAMPAEFAYLIKLHNEGVLKLHLGECQPQKKCVCDQTNKM
ncbi:hypothetical protein WMY93_003397 [Mugilogobius chulae]|uniref:Uncharacterized protein n=1 Tax=Mugilogobius chulae TaxID=88201 RepID=A0AAW0QBI8_9GOBI